MRLFVRAALVGLLVVGGGRLALAQSFEPPFELPEIVAQKAETAQEKPPLEGLQEELERLQKEIAQVKGDDKLKQLVLDYHEKTLKALEKLAAAIAARDRQAAEREKNALLAAQRDRQLAEAVDELKEQRDSDQRNGVLLPAPLRELFLPTRTNESPLAIYGTLAFDYQDFQDRTGNFSSPVFSPHFFLLLNEQFLFEINPEFRSAGIELQAAQIDWFMTDHLTLVAGRFYSPLGFFNERLHTSWVFKTPDRPLMFSQVYPAPMNLTGVQLRGARFVGDLPVKLEYAGFVSNGLSLDARNPTARDFADLRITRDPFDDVNQSKAWGGRLGLNFPLPGIIVGLSGMANGAYDRAGQHDISLWGLDVGWHKGNWDFRFELARTHQQAPVRSIDRRGLYAQIAYRDYQNSVPFLSRLEGVFRYDLVDFSGINLAATGLEFGGRERIPVDRQRFTFGVNYWFYESLAFKLAYEINDELRFRELSDNGVIAQLTWGW